MPPEQPQPNYRAAQVLLRWVLDQLPTLDVVFGGGAVVVVVGGGAVVVVVVVVVVEVVVGGGAVVVVVAVVEVVVGIAVVVVEVGASAADGVQLTWNRHVPPSLSDRAMPSPASSTQAP